MEIIKKYRFSSLFLIVLIISIISSCASWQNNYGKVRILPENLNEVSIQDLIDNWDDYNIYYSDNYEESNVRTPLGIMFDPINDDTTLVGDQWKKVRDQEALIELARWIYPTTQYEPWLNEILGPDGRVYGYLYYSYGFVTIKVVDNNTMYVFNLEEPREEGLGEPNN